MRPLRLAAVLSSVALFATGADFEQGRVDRASPMIRSRLAAEPVPSHPKRKIGRNVPSATHNRLQNYLQNNAALVQMQGLLRNPRMGQLTPELQERLRAEGTGRTSERDGLLPQAVG